jgi:hypothetical protein
MTNAWEDALIRRDFMETRTAVVAESVVKLLSLVEIHLRYNYDEDG